MLYRVRDPGTSLGFFPFSAIFGGRDKQDFTLIAAHPQVFATSRRVDARHKLQVYSTLLALLGFRTYRA